MQNASKSKGEVGDGNPFVLSPSDRNLLSKIVSDLERSEKSDAPRLEEKVLDEFL